MGAEQIEKGLGKLKLVRRAPEVAEKVKPRLPSGKPLPEAPREPKVTLKPQRMYGNVQGVGKRGEWKTIDQRELSASRARRTQRRGKAAVVAGGTTAVTAYAAGHGKGTMTVLGNRNRAWEEAGRLHGGAKLLRTAEASMGDKAHFAARAVGKNPLGAALIGGAALAGVGGVGYGQGKVREGYHQSRINARRKANMSRGVGKRAPMDHESSGFARYGDGSVKGKRLPDEFAKGAPLSVTNPLRSEAHYALADAKAERLSGQKYASRISLRMAGDARSRLARAKGIPSRSPYDVAKRVRNKDAESDRQRRLGMGVAATTVGSGLLLRRGLGGAVKTTRGLRTSTGWKKLSDPMREMIDHADEAGKPVKGKGLAITRRQLAETAGGSALGGAALGLEHYSRGQRNRRWE